MSIDEKISPAFEPLLSERGINEKIDAVVIYESPAPEDLPTAEQLRSNKLRLSYLKERAKLQQSVQSVLFDTYQTESAKVSRSSIEPAITPIGSGAIPVASVEVTRRTLPMLAQQPNVVAVMPNQRIQLIKPYDSPGEGLNKQEIVQGATWGLQHLEIPKLWEKTKGEGIRVAVLDTGVYGDHPALEGRVKDFVVIDSLFRRIKATPSFDAEIHGTHVCGTIAGGKTPSGVSIGVAPAAELLVGSVLIGNCTLFTLMHGISWAVENGAQILNMSVGVPCYEPNFEVLFETLLEQLGVASVVAIGNDSHGSASSPGNAHSAFAVGAVERQSRRHQVDVCSFSSGASLVFPGLGNHELVTKPDVVAPGFRVYSCIPADDEAAGLRHSYDYLHGTSMATPHVSGALALLMAAKPDVPTIKLLEALKDTAYHPLGNRYRPDNRWGYGVIRPLEALNALDS